MRKLRLREASGLTQGPRPGGTTGGMGRMGVGRGRGQGGLTPRAPGPEDTFAARPLQALPLGGCPVAAPCEALPRVVTILTQAGKHQQGAGLSGVGSGHTRAHPAPGGATGRIPNGHPRASSARGPCRLHPLCPAMPPFRVVSALASHREVGWGGERTQVGAQLPGPPTCSGPWGLCRPGDLPGPQPLLLKTGLTPEGLESPAGGDITVPLSGQSAPAPSAGSLPHPGLFCPFPQ